MSQSQDSHSVGLLILPHASLSHYGQIAELLLHTNRVFEHPKYRLQAMSVGGNCVLGKVINYLDSERVDTLFVIGDLITSNETDTMLERWLVQQTKMGVNMLAIGTGILPLANAGLLNGKRSCCHWSVIEKLRPEAANPGQIESQDGAVLGEHKGIINYTVGQRRGLGIGGGDPLYVIKLDADSREVIVGPKEALATRTVLIKEINWLGEDNFLDSKERTLAVRVRSTRSPKEAIIKPISETTATVELVMAEEGIAPGQACVFYDVAGTRIYGGGWITNN